MVKYVILGLQRTGTTLVVSLLQSHPGILSLGEIFSQKENVLKENIPSYRLFLRQLPGLVSEDEWTEKTLYQYLETIFSKTGFSAIGFKLMLNQTVLYPFLWNYIKENGFKIIRVSRENILHTVISKFRSRTTGVYNNLQPGYRDMAPQHKKINVPVNALIGELDKIAEQTSNLSRKISELGLDCIDVLYEKLTKNTAKETKVILDFLEVDTEIPLSTPLEKVSPALLKESIENFDEVVEAIANTPYAIYLESEAM